MNIVNKRGKLFVFEGPDGVGKSTLCRTFSDRLKERRIDCESFSFPGRESGTLGEHVYQLHHRLKEIGIARVSPASRQLLHIAAHIDAIELRLLPALKSGRWIVLDRFWWSTWVYGRVDSIPAKMLHAMLAVENHCWGKVKPDAVFLIDRAIPPDASFGSMHSSLTREYRILARREKQKHPVHLIQNNGTPEDALAMILRRSFTL